MKICLWSGTWKPFRMAMRYWFPQRLIMKKMAKEIEMQIYRWLWWHISFGEEHRMVNGKKCVWRGNDWVEEIKCKTY